MTIIGVIGTVLTAALMAWLGLSESGRAKKEAAERVEAPLPKKEPTPPQEKPATSTREKPRPTPSASQFVGRWKLVNDKGVTAAYMNVTKSFTATRDHVPDFPGRWEIVGNEARFTWDDGFRDVFRLEDGRMTMFGLGKATTWDAPPLFQLEAVRIPPKR